MKHIKTLLFLSIIIIGTQSSFSQGWCGTPFITYFYHNASPIKDNRIIFTNDVSFSFKYTGFRRYMSYIKKNDIELHSVIKEDFKELTKKYYISKVINIAGLTTGGFLIYKGVDNNTSSNKMTYVASGIITIIVGHLISQYFNVSKKDLLHFMKINNENTNQNKMYWEYPHPPMKRYPRCPKGISLGFNLPIR